MFKKYLKLVFVFIICLQAGCFKTATSRDTISAATSTATGVVTEKAFEPNTIGDASGVFFFLNSVLSNMGGWQ